MSSAKTAGWRRLRPTVLGGVVVAALGIAGCGEKSEPAVHPPTTAATTTAPPTATAPAPTGTKPSQTKPTQTPTAPVPKQTP